ncbi:cytochrome ubiquinol oxidase subunit I, partial [Francisella tularensis]|uniref:cytochrome ubiquinol oxidase subunit I n=1 Tax=Francisella tularensis TaxID=263 RepID=UPI002381C655
RKKIESAKWFLKLFTLTTPLGFVATITGWFTAEFGRQPLVVYNILRTEYSVSDLSFWHVFSSLAYIIIVYFIIFGYFYFKYLF